MKYRCLRDCFVQDTLHKEGEIYELPDDFPKYEKNFELMDQPAPEPESGAVEAPEQKPAAPEPVKPDVIPTGQYWCTKCKSLHRETSRIGKRHLGFKG